MKKHIPNFLTICNLLCGCLAVASAFRAEYQQALIFILVSAAFDFLDGFAARLLKAYSNIGKELDSLADMVSFGFAPAMLASTLLWENSSYPHQLWAWIGLAIAAFSALRLAKFNIDDRQTTSFIGLAVPANAIFWAGLANSYSVQIADIPLVTIILIPISCFLLVCNLPMFSLKFKSYSWKGNEFRWILISGALILLIFLQLNAFLWIIVFYILLSIIKNSVCKNS
ncbi:MAG: CDP-diacylglycerol--serine O-phosphatidyltransferase [Prevotellaceae bacterium]|jgi:CDP-diacylglycerol--serine O-phosphatidyltransferase|nr:CDP-diacylglycerol--serine O-phosphatidyltransferase [Prevotellaceae bacterium]